MARPPISVLDRGWPPGARKGSVSHEMLYVCLWLLTKDLLENTNWVWYEISWFNVYQRHFVSIFPPKTNQLLRVQPRPRRTWWDREHSFLIICGASSKWVPQKWLPQKVFSSRHAELWGKKSGQATCPPVWSQEPGKKNSSWCWILVSQLFSKKGTV